MTLPTDPQHTDHGDMTRTDASSGAPEHDGMDHGTMDHSTMNHGTMNHSGHGDHVGQFRRLFWLMLVLMVPVVAFSTMFADLLNYDLPEAAWAAWVSPVLGTVMYLWGGRPFLTGAISELRQRSPGMMLLIALAITVAFLSSWGASLGILAMELDFWWELALLIVIMLLGHWIEMRSLAQSSSALDSLAALLPDEAERVDAGEVTAPAIAAAIRAAPRLPQPYTNIYGDGRADERLVEAVARIDLSPRSLAKQNCY